MGIIMNIMDESVQTGLSKNFVSWVFTYTLYLT